MQAGFYETDITPPIGTKSAGGYSKGYLRGIHDPLKVRAAVFVSGEKKIALVGVDICYIGFDTVEEVQCAVRTRCGIAPEDLIIGASHTHSGPALSTMFNAGLLSRMPADIVELAANASSPSPGYREWAVKQIITAITEADSRKETALLSTGTGREDSCIFNRRFKMKNGRCYTHPGKRNPDIIEPAGPVDPEVGVIGAWRKDGSLIGCIVNYACHGTCCNTAGVVSADWIYYLQKTVRRMMGAKTGFVFLNGACGDVTQVDNLSGSSDFGYKVAEKLGTRVGAEVIKVLTGAETSEYRELESERLVLDVKRRVPSPESIDESWEILRTLPTDSTEPKVIFARERIIAGAISKISPAAEVPVNVIKIGNAVIVANPAEFFAEFGLRIKRDSKFEYTMVVSLANGSVGYVPTKESFDLTGGGYETVLTSYSNLEISAGDKITEAALELINRLEPEKINMVSEPAITGKPWGYGILGPNVT